MEEKAKSKSKSKTFITGETMISEIMDNYPDVVDFLVDEYGFFCMNCFMSEFETLEDGAMSHGIVGEDFAEMLRQVNEMIVNH